MPTTSMDRAHTRACVLHPLFFVPAPIVMNSVFPTTKLRPVIHLTHTLDPQTTGPSTSPTPQTTSNRTSYQLCFSKSNPYRTLQTHIVFCLLPSQTICCQKNRFTTLTKKSSQNLGMCFLKKSK
jgi:hypothetical protein